MKLDRRTLASQNSNLIWLVEEMSAIMEQSVWNKIKRGDQTERDSVCLA